MVNSEADNRWRKTDLELITEGFIIEKDPWVLVLPIPMVFELSHALHDAL